MPGDDILIVDDSRLHREVLRVALAQEGYNVRLAVNGSQGVEMALATPPALVITDKDMPIVSGEEVCRRLKAEEATRMVPVIMFTGSGADAVEQLDAGADDYLTKTRDLRELKAKVRVFLRIKRLQDQIREQNEQLKRENEANERELHMARMVQVGLLPRRGGRRGRLDVAFRYIPTRYVGGDLFDVFEEPDGAASFFVSDVSGHGVGPAFVTAMVKTSVLAQSAQAANVGQLVERVNQSVAKLLVEDMYFTAFFGRVDPTGTRLEYVNAGHPPALILRAGGAGVDLLDNTGFPVGIMEEAAFDMAETSLHAGDRVVLYTDGVTEALNQNLDLFGMKRFQDSLAARAQASLDVMADGVIEDLIAYCGGDVFNDDVNLLICEVVGP